MMYMVNHFDQKFKAFLRLCLLQLLIPADGYFEPALPLALDAALVDWEGQ